MRALISLGGEQVSRTVFRERYKQANTSICADSGLDIFYQNGILPDLIVGDMDSVSPSAYKWAVENNITLQKYSTKKDETDAILALDYAINAHYKNIDIIGALGKRFDHSFANIGLLLRAEESHANAKIYDSNGVLFLAQKYTEITGNTGDILSLLPLETLFINSTAGLEYPIINKSMSLSFPYGISNVLTCNKAAIDIQHGKALIYLLSN